MFSHKICVNKILLIGQCRCSFVNCPQRENDHGTVYNTTPEGWAEIFVLHQFFFWQQKSSPLLPSMTCHGIHQDFSIQGRQGWAIISPHFYIVEDLYKAWQNSNAIYRFKVSYLSGKCLVIEYLVIISLSFYRKVRVAAVVQCVLTSVQYRRVLHHSAIQRTEYKGE